MIVEINNESNVEFLEDLASGDFFTTEDCDAFYQKVYKTHFNGNHTNCVEICNSQGKKTGVLLVMPSDTTIKKVEFKGFFYVEGVY